MTNLPSLAAATLIALAPAFASAQVATPLPDHDAVRAGLEVIAVSLDSDHDGRLDAQELAAGADAIFTSMDIDHDGYLALVEMTGWEMGFSDIAVLRGKTEAHDAAMGVVFGLMDRDYSGKLEADEYRDGIARAAFDADRDGDGAMSLDEMEKGFLPSVAVQTSLAP